MTVKVQNIRFHRLPMRTRFPFRYGIATLTQLPHLFVVADVEVDGCRGQGTSADGLPPKWFTKNPDTDFESEDLPEMLSVIRRAADTTVQMPAATSIFSWWRDLYDQQSAWGHKHNLPPLLTSLGVSLIERAVLDAFCRIRSCTFFEALRDNALQIDLASIRPELQGIQLRDLLADRPARELSVRHTVGMADPLRTEEISAVERVDDRLPHSLEESIRRYGLRYFKIKLHGNVAEDRARLCSIASVLREAINGQYFFTLDGNENYASAEDFRSQWECLQGTDSVREFLNHGLLFVEQPIHRDTALEVTPSNDLHRWAGRPAMIIDESDGDLGALPRALDAGYCGTSHKNCKGVIKSVLQLATIQARRAKGERCILSAEDLGNVGPIALPQDLAVVAALGLSHVERNGHHYFAGLSMLPEMEQRRVLRTLPRLYAESDLEYPTLDIRQGKVDLADVNRAPLGVPELPDMSLFEAWEF